MTRASGMRFIPTRVGNTQTPNPSFEPTAVHPHAGGEHDAQRIVLRGNVGSSPRGWGTPLHRADEFTPRRFIPTRVGNTVLNADKGLCRPVHPHAGGEHPGGRRPCLPKGGSSPRGWGTRCVETRNYPRVRFIPTRVGNTILRRPSRRAAPVHPHAGGEHTARHARGVISCGSSPRGWGTQAHVRRAVLHLRFIPTRVGNTKAT